MRLLLLRAVPGPAFELLVDGAGNPSLAPVWTNRVDVVLEVYRYFD